MGAHNSVYEKAGVEALEAWTEVLRVHTDLPDCLIDLVLGMVVELRAFVVVGLEMNYHDCKSLLSLTDDIPLEFVVSIGQPGQTSAEAPKYRAVNMKLHKDEFHVRDRDEESGFTLVPESLYPAGTQLLVSGICSEGVMEGDGHLVMFQVLPTATTTLPLLPWSVEMWRVHGDRCFMEAFEELGGISVQPLLSEITMTRGIFHNPSRAFVNPDDVSFAVPIPTSRLPLHTCLTAWGGRENVGLALHLVF